MERSMFTDVELQLTTEQSTKYQGTVKINLSQIAFHPSLSRELDQKNVERLCEIFNRDDCQWLDIQHHVTAVVSQQHLANTLHAAHVTAHALLTNPSDRYPQLQFPTGQIRCVHSQHCLKADISSDLQASLVDKYSNKKPPSDGEVYRKVRQYQYEANARFEERWKSRLSSNKAKQLRQLSSPAHIDEIITYLAHVKQFWSSLMDDDRNKMMKIDLHTVEILQLLAPGLSHKDAKTVRAVLGSLKPPDPAVKYCMIQTSETGHRRSGSPTQRAELGYRQLWLYTMRHYLKMPREPESDDLVAKPGHEKADETALHEMAVLAQKLGFDSPQITDLIELSPDHQIMRAVLLKAQDPERFRYKSGVFETLIGRIAECFSLAVPVERQLSCDFTPGSEAKPYARCGLPHARAQQQDHRFLFIDQLHTDEIPAAGKVSTLFPLTSPPPDHTWVGAAPLGSDPSNLPMSPLFIPDDSPLTRFGQAPLLENDGYTTIDHGELGPMQLEVAQRATAEETRVHTEVEEREIALQAEQAREQAADEAQRQTEAEEMAAAEAAKRLAQCQKEAEERAFIERYAAEQEQFRQEQLRQEEERVAAKQYAVELEQLRQREEEKLAAERYAAEQEQLRQEEEEARVAVERYAGEQEQLRRDAEEAAAEQVKREQIQREQEERHTVERAEQEQVQKEAEERAAIGHAAGKARLQQEAEERAVAEQADHERPAREAAEPVQLQLEEEERAAVPTAAEETHTPQPVTQLDFTPFMPIKSDGAHSTVDPASTERATNVADPPPEVEISQTRQGKLRRPGGIPKASERGVSQGTARIAAAERSLKTGNRLQRSQPDSQLQGASRLEDVSTGARTVMIIFKAREQGNWVDTYKMVINPSEPSDRSMCCDAAIEDGINTVFMVFDGELNVNEEMMASVSQYADSERE
ncbi:hypothetical protein I7I51_03832 [Histoplasma capsulatum]|uniref:Uncharacterized protein n=1 Tax=Ajellomyces capsulatus TaxID=5037 RepID=A0A8A1M7I8_AJECA|nr:hypothetical protein I7I51_03832 [Histoplasma capsulatum]